MYLISAQHPQWAPRFARGQVREGVQGKEAEATQSCGVTPEPPATASLPQRCTQGPPLLLPCQAGSHLHWPVVLSTRAAQLSLQGICLCGLHKGNVSSELSIVPFTSGLLSVPSVRRSDIKSLQSKRIHYFIQISEKVLLTKPAVDGYYTPLTEALMIRLKITS